MWWCLWRLGLLDDTLNSLVTGLCIVVVVQRIIMLHCLLYCVIELLEIDDSEILRGDIFPETVRSWNILARIIIASLLHAITDRPQLQLRRRVSLNCRCGLFRILLFLSSVAASFWHLVLIDLLFHHLEFSLYITTTTNEQRIHIIQKVIPFSHHFPLIIIVRNGSGQISYLT